MHIGFLTPEYPHDKINHSGGLGSSLQNLAISLQAKGVNISVFVYGQKTNTEFENLLAPFLAPLLQHFGMIFGICFL